MEILEEIKKMKEEKTQQKRKSNKELLEDLEQANNIRDKKVKQESVINELNKRIVDNIRISESERVKINKNDFTNKDEVIDILLNIVSKMTLEDNFYENNIQKLKNYKPINNNKTE